MRWTPLCVALCLSATPLVAQDADRSVEDGGVHVEGWEVRIDRNAMAEGMSGMDSRMAEEDGAIRLSVGPAGLYWSPANQASGNYEVSGTFTEHESSAGHPHPYGVFIGGRGLKTPTEKLMYCIVYGDGSFVVKSFHGPEVTTLHDREPHAAVNRAAGGAQVTNTVGWRVQDGTATCTVNGTDVASFSQDEVVGPEMLESLDGIYGIRVSHNVELTVSDFGMAMDGGM